MWKCRSPKKIFYEKVWSNYGRNKYRIQRKVWDTSFARSMWEKIKNTNTKDLIEVFLLAYTQDFWEGQNHKNLIHSFPMKNFWIFIHITMPNYNSYFGWLQLYMDFSEFELLKFSLQHLSLQKHEINLTKSIYTTTGCMTSILIEITAAHLNLFNKQACSYVEVRY